MAARYKKRDKKIEFCLVNVIDKEAFIERLKKVRALNCNPSDIGMDGYRLKRMPFNKLNLLTRFP